MQTSLPFETEFRSGNFRYTHDYVRSPRNGETGCMLAAGHTELRKGKIAVLSLVRTRVDPAGPAFVAKCRWKDRTNWRIHWRVMFENLGPGLAKKVQCSLVTVASGNMLDEVLESSWLSDTIDYPDMPGLQVVARAIRFYGSHVTNRARVIVGRKQRCDPG